MDVFKKNLLVLLGILCLAGVSTVYAEDSAADNAQTTKQQAAADDQAAEDADANAPADEVPPPAEPMVTEASNDLASILENAREKAGLDGDKFYTAIGRAGIGVAPDKRDYVLARQTAFNRAFAAAMNEIVTQISQEMSQKVQSGLLSSNDTLSKADIDPALAGLINAELKKQLVASGVNLQDKEAIKKALPKITSSEAFSQVLNSSVNTYLSGIVAYKSVVIGKEIGVLAYYSDTMAQLSRAMLTGKKFPKRPAGKKLFAVAKEIAPTELANTFGSRIYVNEQGTPCIVAFAHALGHNQTATLSARMSADGFIQDFIGASFAIESAKQNAESVAVLTDDLGNETSVSKVTEKLAQIAKRENSKLEYNGIKTIRQRSIKLPSGHKVTVVIRAWSPVYAKMGKKSMRQGRRDQALREQVRQQQIKEKNTPVTLKKKSKKNKPAVKASSVAKPAVERKSVYNNTETTGDGAAGTVF